jgi:hypothetical protein
VRLNPLGLSYTLSPNTCGSGKMLNSNPVGSY